MELKPLFPEGTVKVESPCCQVKMGFWCDYAEEFWTGVEAGEIQLPEHWTLNESYITPIASMLVFETDECWFPTRLEALQVRQMIETFDREQKAKPPQGEDEDDA